MSTTQAGNAKEIFTKYKLLAVLIALGFSGSFAFAQAQPPQSVYTSVDANEICVTDKVPPGTKANDEARRLADEAVTKSCMKSKP